MDGLVVGALGVPVLAVLAGALGRARAVVALTAASCVAGAVLLALVYASGARNVEWRAGDLAVVLQADRATTLLLVVVLGIATVVQSFGRRYPHGDPQQRALTAGIAAICAATAVMVVAGTLLLFACAWTAASAAVYVLVRRATGTGASHARRQTAVTFRGRRCDRLHSHLRRLRTRPPRVSPGPLALQRAGHAGPAHQRVARRPRGRRDRRSAAPVRARALRRHVHLRHVWQPAGLLPVATAPARRTGCVRRERSDTSLQARQKCRMNDPVAPTEWTFLTNHARVLLCVARDPQMRLRDVAEAVQITERAAQRIVADLVEAGYLERSRDGRRNRYQVHPELPLRHPLDSDHPIGDILAVLGAIPEGAPKPPRRGKVRSA